MRTTRVLVVVAVVAAAGTGAWAITRQDPAAPKVSGSPVAVTSVTVGRGDIVARMPLGGTLGYDGSFTIVSQLPPGVITSVPAPGAVIKRGRRLFAVGAASTVLLYGRTPAYRAFALGMADGADVKQLERNLKALGMEPGTVDRHFSASTAAAVRRWQKARGLPYASRTGRLEPGDVIFLPGAVRVTQIHSPAGALAGPGAQMLVVSSTTKVVRVSLTTDRRSQVHVGDRVSVSLYGSSHTYDGRIRSIGKVATTPPQQQQGPPGSEGPATIPLTISLVKPGRELAQLDQAPVNVDVISERRQDVLTVPVTALLAGTNGGYQVAVLDGTARRLVQVVPGVYDDQSGTVEVTGVEEGAKVEVPVS
jgi:peptidoglycan hydrolase-like protein with peptidoglycan-binding domain